MDKLKAFSLRECIFLTSETWDQISESTLKNAWNNFGIKNNIIAEFDSSSTLASELAADLKFLMKLNDSEISEYKNIDSNEQGFEFLTRDEIITSVQLESTESYEELEEDEDSNNCKTVNHKEALKAIETIINYSEEKQLFSLEAIKFFRSIQEVIENTRNNELKQESIMKFLLKSKK